MSPLQFIEVTSKLPSLSGLYAVVNESELSADMKGGCAAFSLQCGGTYPCTHCEATSHKGLTAKNPCRACNGWWPCWHMQLCALHPEILAKAQVATITAAALVGGKVVRKGEVPLTWQSTASRQAGAAARSLPDGDSAPCVGTPCAPAVVVPRLQQLDLAASTAPAAAAGAQARAALPPPTRRARPQAASAGASRMAQVMRTTPVAPAEPASQRERRKGAKANLSALVAAEAASSDSDVSQEEDADSDVPADSDDSEVESSAGAAHSARSSAGTAGASAGAAKPNPLMPPIPREQLLVNCTVRL